MSASNDAAPNAAHSLLVHFESSLPLEQKFLLVTQNVDGLHQKAGSGSTVELHGSILRTRWSRYECSLAPFQDDEDYAQRKPVCAVCGSLLRPDMVFFGEVNSPRAEHAVMRALRDCDLFVSVGTSGTVYPANGFARRAQYAGALTVFINLEPTDPSNPSFQVTMPGRAEELLQALTGGRA